MLTEPVGELPSVEAAGRQIQHDAFLLIKGGVNLCTVEHEERLHRAMADALVAVHERVVRWSVAPLQVEEVHSSYFSDEATFSKGSVEFDCALVMRNLGHEWHSAEDLPGAGERGCSPHMGERSRAT